MLEGMKSALLHKLTLRVCYILAAFSSAQIVAFASSDKVQSTIASLPPLLAKAGITFNLQFQIHDPSKLKIWISGFVLIAGEFIYHWIHTKFILPKVTPATATPVTVKP